MFRVRQDFVHDMPVQTALDLIERHKGKLAGFKLEGPGGGNPCLTIDFENADEALTFLREMQPDEADEFLQTQIRIY